MMQLGPRIAFIGALDKAIELKETLEQPLAERWQDLFGAKYDLLLYDLTPIFRAP
ncbi:MAG: hypothetical protein WB586_03880 [Chthoniobacterales bacterium]